MGFFKKILAFYNICVTLRLRLWNDCGCINYDYGMVRGLKLRLSKGKIMVNINCRFVMGHKPQSPALKSDKLYAHPSPPQPHLYFLPRYITGTLLPASAVDIDTECKSRSAK